jgi:hypothetical protein
MAYLTNKTFPSGNWTYEGESYGFIHATGLWEDLRFPAQAINPPGPTGAPGRSSDTAMLEFDKNATEMLAGAAQMPHSWKSPSNPCNAPKWSSDRRRTAGIISLV